MFLKMSERLKFLFPIVNLIFFSPTFSSSIQKQPAETFCQEGVLKNFTNFTKSLFLI